LQSIDLADLVRSAAAPFSALAETEGVTLTVAAAASRPPAVALLRIQADAARLTQAVQNLLVNALRHTPAGGVVTVTTGVDEKEAWLSVTDSGEGIAAEHLPRVFDRFYRADPTRARDTGGAGLGLAIAQAIVEAHGGRVTVVSAGVGQGTTFTICFPHPSVVP
jgi:signal transduction histidine kinase